MFKTHGSRRHSGRKSNGTGLERLDLGELHFAAEMPAGRSINLAGRGTTFVREADGPPGAPTILLVHGLFASADLNWSLAIPELASAYRVVAPDLRGHGDGIRTRRFDASECADDLAAIVDVLNLGSVIVVGYSLGGLVAQLFARRHPELVSGLVLCATAHNFAESGGGAMTRLMSRAALIVPEAIRRALMMAVLAPRSGGSQATWVMEQVGKHNTRSILQAAAQATSFDSSDWLGTLATPSAVVLTAGDQVVSAEVQRELCRVLGSPVVHELEGDHFVCVKEPGVFNEALVAACADVRNRARLTVGQPVF